ncbi:hypothetical protein H4R26_002648 [Coemansia thaxteri]|uniref:protein-tyrosine-phosphatase n=1 Tax=Coemansia thaxteri TaxID=2663907 RepID=A0A9W8EFF4_9FUNG|nr:hypothetical protein H4R26_002648 [Coemansia thaxteri]
MKAAPNRHLARAATAPASVMPLVLPLRRLATRQTMPSSVSISTSSFGSSATSLGGSGLQLSLTTGGLRTPPNSNPHTTSGDGVPPTPALLTVRPPPVLPLVGSLALASLNTNDGGGCSSGDVAMRAARTYRTGPQLIMPYLYLGGEGNVAREQLDVLEITHVLNVAREVTAANPGGSTTYRHLGWDHNEPDVAAYFTECFAFIDEARIRHRGVLVHCQMGVSRSASLIIAYVMRTMNMRFAAAYEYVRLRAPCISPNMSLIAQLNAYGEFLNSSSSSYLSPAVGVADLPELSSTTDCSEASSANSSPMDDNDVLLDDNTAISAGLLTLPIKQLAVRPPLVINEPAAAAASGGNKAVSKGSFHVVALCHPLVP